MEKLRRKRKGERKNDILFCFCFFVGLERNKEKKRGSERDEKKRGSEFVLCVGCLRFCFPLSCSLFFLLRVLSLRVICRGYLVEGTSFFV